MKNIQNLLLVTAVFSLTACGFQLRGQATLPFETLFISAPAGHPIGTDLKTPHQVRYQDACCQ